MKKSSIGCVAKNNRAFLSIFLFYKSKWRETNESNESVFCSKKNKGEG